MNDLPKPKTVPGWRIICYSLLAAAGVAGIGYWQNDHALYLFAIFAGAAVGGLGFVLQSARTTSQIGTEIECRKVAAKHKSTALVIFQVLAIPTAVVGAVLIYDLFIAAPEHVTTTLIGKHVSSGRRGRHVYNLEVKGRREYHAEVSSWFYNRCSLNDTIELSLTPVFKDWLQASLVRNGLVVAKTTPPDTYYMTFFGFGSLLPILLLMRPVRDCFGEGSSVPFHDKITSLYFFIVAICEIMAIALCIKFVCVLTGLSARM